MPQNFATIANISRLVDIESFVIAPDHEIRRATAEEITIWKSAVRHFLPYPPDIHINFWECRLPLSVGPIEILPEADWRYFVIGFTGLNSTIEDLKLAACLAPLELDIQFTIFFQDTPNPSRTWSSERIIQSLSSFRTNPSSFFQEVRQADLQAIKEINEHMNRHDHNLLDVKQVATQLKELKTIPRNSSLRILGYFGILESLLTHSPKPNDPYDSITRQIVNKIELLNNRWHPSIDYSPFPGTTHKAIWEKMYKLRSLLAHGGRIDFSSGELRTIGNYENALKLVKEATKSIARQALLESRLIIALRNC